MKMSILTSEWPLALSPTHMKTFSRAILQVIFSGVLLSIGALSANAATGAIFQNKFIWLGATNPTPPPGTVVFHTSHIVQPVWASINIQGSSAGLNQGGAGLDVVFSSTLPDSGTDLLKGLTADQIAEVVKEVVTLKPELAASLVAAVVARVPSMAAVATFAAVQAAPQQAAAIQTAVKDVVPGAAAEVTAAATANSQPAVISDTTKTVVNQSSSYANAGNAAVTGTTLGSTVTTVLDTTARSVSGSK